MVLYLTPHGLYLGFEFLAAQWFSESGCYKEEAYPVHTSNFPSTHITILEAPAQPITASRHHAAFVSCIMQASHRHGALDKTMHDLRKACTNSRVR